MGHIAKFYRGNTYLGLGYVLGNTGTCKVIYLQNRIAYMNSIHDTSTIVDYTIISEIDNVLNTIDSDSIFVSYKIK